MEGSNDEEEERVRKKKKGDGEKKATLGAEKGGQIER